MKKYNLGTRLANKCANNLKQHTGNVNIYFGFKGNCRNYSTLDFHRI